jgi:hypothetical protein
MAATKAAAPAKTRTPPRNTFKIRFQIEGSWYSVVPLKPDPGVARKAYRMSKLDARGKPTAEYDVSIDAEGQPACECKGWLRYHKPCRHLRTLAAAGMIELPPPRKPLTVNEPVPQAEPVSPEQEGGADGQEAA